jgi:hypothetical protein
MKLRVRQFRERHLVVHDLQRTLWVAPLPDTGSDLTIAWVKLSVICNVHYLICPVVHQEKAGRPVSWAEPIDITDGPAAYRALTGHFRISTDRTKAFAFGHSGADGVGDFSGVIGLRHFFLFLSRAILRKCNPIP